MADQDRPNQTANKSKAEGERWQPDPDPGQDADRDEAPERLYPDNDADSAGGITNRPLSQEIGNQEALPERGTSRDRSRRDPAMPADDSALDTKI